MRKKKNVSKANFKSLRVRVQHVLHNGGNPIADNVIQ